MAKTLPEHQVTVVRLTTETERTDSELRMRYAGE